MKILRIGRSSRNDIVINDPSVSSQHAEISISDLREVRIKDLNSTNGTFVNDKQIFTETMITASDRIKAGKCSLDWVGYLNRSTPQPVSGSRMFGTTIRETMDVLKITQIPEKKDDHLKREQKIVIFRTITSLAVLITAIICLGREGHSSTGIGLIGTIIGYWLK